MMDKILNECKKEHDHKEDEGKKCDPTIDKDNKKQKLKEYINGEFKNEIHDLAGKTYNWTEFNW